MCLVETVKNREIKNKIYKAIKKINVSKLTYILNNKNKISKIKL